MTKEEFQDLRRHYRMVCKADWQAFRRADDNSFLLSDDASYLFGLYWKSLTAFAAQCGCTVRQAADMLNLEMGKNV